jgi:FlgD Ig-like domain
LRHRSAPGIVVALLTLATLHVISHPAHAQTGSITLSWTAPGDDSLSGTAKAYDLRYSLNPITAANFTAAYQMAPEPVPLAPGNKQTTTVRGLTGGSYYYFAIRTVDDAGNWSGLSNVAHLMVGGPLAVGDAPPDLAFSAPFPNPSRATASFTLTLPSAMETSIEVYDASGRRVRTLARGDHGAGRETIVWDLRDEAGRPLASGLYLVHAWLGTQVFVRRVIVTR